MFRHIMFLYFVAGVINVARTGKEYSEEELTQLAFECLAELKLAEEEIEELHKTNNEESINPCLVSCLLKKIEIFDSDGMFDVEQALEYSKSNIHNDEDLKIVIQIIDECSKVNDEVFSDGKEDCQRARSLLICVKDLQKALNFEI